MQVEKSGFKTGSAFKHANKKYKVSKYSSLGRYLVIKFEILV